MVIVALSSDLSMEMVFAPGQIMIWLAWSSEVMTRQRVHVRVFSKVRQGYVELGIVKYIPT